MLLESRTSACRRGGVFAACDHHSWPSGMTQGLNPSCLLGDKGRRAIAFRHVTEYPYPMAGRKPIGDQALTSAERMRTYRERRKATEKPIVIRYRKPTDRRSRPKQWADAVATLLEMLDRYQEWRDNLPPGLVDSTIAERLDEVLELRDLVEQLDNAQLPNGFGRD